jgi:hypothetical protein
MDLTSIDLTTTEDDQSRVLEHYYDQWWSASRQQAKLGSNQTWSVETALGIYRQQVTFWIDDDRSQTDTLVFQVAKAEYPRPSAFFDKMEDIVHDLLGERNQATPDYKNVLEQIEELAVGMANTRIA